MSEGALWLSARTKLAPFGRLCRIENRVDKGTPDVFYTLRRPRTTISVSGWWESKHCPKWPAGADTPLVLPKLLLEQVTWIEDEHKAGGRVGMLLQVGKDYVFADAALTRRIYDRTVTRAELVFAYPGRIADSLTRPWLLHWLTT